MIGGALLLALLGALWRISLWRRGRAAKVDLVGGLLALPKRYLVDLHEVVARDRYIANTHVATAGGFVLASLLILPVFLFGLHVALLEWALTAVLFVVAVGALFVAARRRRNRPARLSKGPWNRLPFSLFAFVSGFSLLILTASPSPQSYALTAIGLLLALWGLAELFVGMTWGGPMKHAFAGALHLAFHPRPERFGKDAISSDLQPLDLTAGKLGVETPADFAWNRLLGFDACVQCGRCEAACPAFAAGQPLNPKKLIQDLVVGFTGPGDDSNYAGSPYPGRPIGRAKGAPNHAIVPDLVDPATLWSCTTCRACVAECPMMIEHVDAIVDLRRFLTLEQGATPGKGAEVLEELRATDNPQGADPGSRLDWAADLKLPLAGDSAGIDVLLWVGDAAFDLRNRRSLRSLVRLLRAAEVDFAVLGEAELDCGDLARRLGDEAIFQDLARRNIETLARVRFARIVTADPHAFHVLRNEYPALGGRYQVMHHTTFLAELIEANRLKLRPAKGLRLTYHDPCYLGRYNGEFDAPRALLRALGAELTEMARSGPRSRCCGGGGGAPVTDIPGERRIPDMRMADVRETAAEVVAVACPNCMTMLEGVVQPRAEVKDLAELLADALEGEAS